MYCKCIGLFGHYGTYNLGDEAIISAIIQSIKRIMSDEAEIIAFSINPKDTEIRHGVKAYPIRNIDFKIKIDTENFDQNIVNNANDETDKVEFISFNHCKNRLKKIAFLVNIVQIIRRISSLTLKICQEITFILKSYGRLKDIDIFIVAGSGQLEDEWGGVMGFPYTIFKWASLAKISKTKLVFLSVGAGPINHALSKLMIRLSLNYSQYASFRDMTSAQWIKNIDAIYDPIVAPDLAHNLITSEVIDNKKAKVDKSRHVVGINTMPILDKRYWFEADDYAYSHYIEKMAEICIRLKKSNIKFFLFSTHPKDELVSKDVITLLSSKFEWSDSELNNLIKKNRSVDQLLETIATSDIVVATRFHAILLSYFSETPVVGICKDHKQRDLMDAMGQKKYKIDFSEFTSEKVFNLISSLLEHSNAEKKCIIAKNKEHEDSLNKQYSFLSKYIINNNIN